MQGFYYGLIRLIRAKLEDSAFAEDWFNSYSLILNIWGLSCISWKQIDRFLVQLRQMFLKLYMGLIRKGSTRKLAGTCREESVAVFRNKYASEATKGKVVHLKLMLESSSLRSLIQANMMGN
ncbi:hypothetical protein L6452_21386 [Arctium lappa]|uniref:Uncharacterized protein n=1 Tax=Arctium lappa TaxID=4217 RepID=A0ACB9BFZ1_ARCLA|nr:hypothetical protein L6452_21386 [Arctium lappa]